MAFLEDHHQSIILIKANTLPRARLYQMMISSIWPAIERQYEVYGKQESNWVHFRKGENYVGFLVLKNFK
jgi:hypothetical protein